MRNARFKHSGWTTYHTSFGTIGLMKEINIIRNPVGIGNEVLLHAFISHNSNPRQL
jgi:hypothetical protein